MTLQHDAPTTKIVWPEGKRFAFTAFDDTDLQTVQNSRPVYDFLSDLGFRTTKSVWPVKPASPGPNGVPTCEDAEYLRWVLDLQRRGFEIGFHSATHHTSPREVTQRAIERFKELFGSYPGSMSNHSGCEEAIYWGDSRLESPGRSVYNLLTGLRNKERFQGHVEASPLFWGDICREKVRYVRNFVYDEINTLKACPFMPYHDPSKPYVRSWYASSEGSNADGFLRMISEENQDRLEEEGGACIMYTHFAYGFLQNGSLPSRFVRLMKRLAAKDGWFVPTSTLLDHIASVRGITILNPAERWLLEGRWLLGKIRSAKSS